MLFQKKESGDVECWCIMMVPTHKYIFSKSLYGLYFTLITTMRILIICYSDGNLEIAIYNTDFKQWKKSCSLIFPCNFLAKTSDQNINISLAFPLRISANTTVITKPSQVYFWILKRNYRWEYCSRLEGFRGKLLLFLGASIHTRISPS